MQLPKAVEVLLAHRAYVIKKRGRFESETGMTDDAEKDNPKQVTWSKYGGASSAWELVKKWSHFL
jgi:hypothetical protein